MRLLKYYIMHMMIIIIIYARLSRTRHISPFRRYAHIKCEKFDDSYRDTAIVTYTLAHIRTHTIVSFWSEGGGTGSCDDGGGVLNLHRDRAHLAIQRTIGNTTTDLFPFGLIIFDRTYTWPEIDEGNSLITIYAYNM